MTDPVSTTEGLAITHTAAEGTLIEGTARGDGSPAVLKECGWRWRRNLGSWYVPRSRDVPADTQRIEATATGLRAVGFAVTVFVDDQQRDTDQVEADRVTRQAERVNALGEVVDRRAAEADRLESTASGMAAGIPFGQPILVGHHSQARDTRYRERIAALSDRAVQARAELREAEHRYAAAAAGTGARYSPVTVANRLERLAANIRDAERRLAGYSHTFAGGYVETYPPATGAHRERLLAELNRAGDQHAYWSTVRAEQVAAGTVTDHSRETVHPGDQVRIRNRWVRVVRANRTTVSVTTAYDWTDTAPYAEIQQVRRAGAVAPEQAPAGSKQ